jgi:hypothetical protein
MKQIELPTVALALVAVLVAVAPVAAERVSGADRLLCAAQQVTVCTPFAECSTGPSVDVDLPDFVVVDIAAKTLSTTAANERPRASPVRYLEREDGHIFLQGLENQRAFSIVVVEETGELSAAVSTTDLNISVYGVCTPLPAEKPTGQ